MSLSVREAGPIDAPAVQKEHGLGLSGAMWQPQFERLADFLLQPYPITQASRELLLTDLRAVQPEATLHGIRELTKLRLPRNDGQVPVLIVVGQKEAIVTQQAAYAMSRAVPCAWIEDEALPSRLLRV